MDVVKLALEKGSGQQAPAAVAAVALAPALAPAPALASAPAPAPAPAPARSRLLLLPRPPQPPLPLQQSEMLPLLPSYQHRLRARRKRKELLLGQVCFLGSLLLLLSSLGNWAEKAGYYIFDHTEANDKWSGRRLLQKNDTLIPENLEPLPGKNCTEPALHEFPNDIFTNEKRRQGAVVLHVLCAMYMFYALAIVCDDFFVPSLEKICERLHLSEDVAGATFMAAGSSAPELFTSVIGVFITKGDVGVGTIVGSAVFNILCIIGVCGLFAGQVVALSSWCLLRDSTYYTLSVVALIVFIYDEKVSWWESLVLVLMYIIYIIIMKYNACIHQCFERRTKSAGNMVNGLANNAEIDDNSNCDATVVLLKKANFHRKASVIMVDELLSAYPHQLSFSEAGLRIMITSHFPPKTRLSMASRMLINERQRLINSRAYANGESEVAIKIPIKHAVENGTGPSNAPERGANGTRRDDDVTEAGNETENENEDNENNENDEEEEEDDDDDDGPYTPFDPPSGKLEIVKWLFTWPLSLVLYFTVPNCNKPQWEKWFMVTFASSTLWIAAFSYMMVWMVTIIGYTLGIPDVIMGITFLAAGTSVPDCMASLIVARQGMGDMAVSNSIGSNVFDILIGLGLPWALQTLAVDYGSYIRLNSRGLIYSVGLLLASVFVTVFGVHMNKWKLDKKLGFVCLFLYGIFLCFSIMTEFNVFTFVNLPMCREH
ncbi:sodium/potassium/calcium exchanger 3 isoform X2 [Monodelphis domestica]|uniref:sodium/potassium/calcium exchanger 3 isoform X2 n=1 Tax=Monodelphis domestica TaxID=13616 RepID=UPI0004436039|nr:sodium/potassium/calcium exchanger 3 isoform X2 [Monodelphis domestica]